MSDKEGLVVPVFWTFKIKKLKVLEGSGPWDKGGVEASTGCFPAVLGGEGGSAGPLAEWDGLYEDPGTLGVLECPGGV